jgi:hypothetical protein
MVMPNPDMNMHTLEQRYKEIQERFEALSDLREEDLAKSRGLFNLEGGLVEPRRFDVWTCLVGLPLPRQLTQELSSIVSHVKKLLPPDVRWYSVIPANYHWELFIIKRPGEEVSLEHLEEAQTMLRQVLLRRKPFAITYRGFLVTQDGTVIVRGFGAFDDLRAELRSVIPFASGYQSNIGHVSLGRILDRVGSTRFAQLKGLVDDSQDVVYGELPVNEVSYVHETQWYMEERDVVATIRLGGDGETSL